MERKNHLWICHLFAHTSIPWQSRLVFNNLLRTLFALLARNRHSTMAPIQRSFDDYALTHLPENFQGREQHAENIKWSDFAILVSGFLIAIVAGICHYCLSRSYLHQVIKWVKKARKEKVRNKIIGSLPPELIAANAPWPGRKVQQLEMDGTRKAHVANQQPRKVRGAASHGPSLSGLTLCELPKCHHKSISVQLIDSRRTWRLRLGSGPRSLQTKVLVPSVTEINHEFSMWFSKLLVQDEVKAKGTAKSLRNG